MIYTLLFPVLYTLFLWWFTTGIIIVVYGRGEWLKRVAYFVATVLMGLSLAGIAIVSRQDDVLSIYQAVTGGVILWGWQVAGYFLGFVTGPDQKPVTASTSKSLGDRFWNALRASLHHELMVIAFGVVLLIVTWGTVNQWALWMYVALWLMHASAKLNVFFGVRNFKIEMMPKHLHHLSDYLSDRQHNGFFPLSVLVATSIMLVLVYQAITPEMTAQYTVGRMMIATMMGLGLLEHWLLVLPVSWILWGFGTRPLSDELNVQQQSIKG